MAKVFLVHFSVVCWCVRRAAISSASSVKLSASELAHKFHFNSFFPDLFWFNPNQGRSAYLVGVKDFSRPPFRTLPSDFPRSDKITFQLQMQNETKSGLETKNFCEILLFWRIIEPRKRDRRSCFDNQTKTESLRENFLLGCCSPWRCASVGARSVRGLLLAQERRRATIYECFGLIRVRMGARASNVQHCALTTSP